MTKAYQERLIALIKDTVTLLCKNGLEYSQEFCVEGLLGVTLDKDEVFLIPIKELVNDKGVGTTDGADETVYAGGTDLDATGDGMSPKRERKKKRRHAESSATQEDSTASYDNGTSELDNDTKERNIDQENEENNTDDQPASKRLHGDTKTDLSKVKAEDIVVIKEEVDDDEFVSAFQDSSMDSGSLNRTEQNESGMAYYSQPGTSHGGTGMGFSMEQLAEGAALSAANMTGMQQGSEGDTSSWLQQSAGNLQNPQGDWQGPKHQVTSAYVRCPVRSRRTRGSGDKLYRCDICNETFAQAHCVRRHKLSVHERVRHYCAFCDKSFCQRGHLAIHVKIRHREMVEAGAAGSAVSTVKRAKGMSVLSRHPAKEWGSLVDNTSITV